MKKLYPAFVSHSSKNDDFVQYLADVLIERGIEVWKDDSAIRVGDIWVEPAEQGIQECQIFLLVISPDSLSSAPVRQEIKWSKQYNKPLMPVLLEKPETWGEYQWLQEITWSDCTTWQETRDISVAEINRLVDGINSHRMRWFTQLLGSAETHLVEGRYKERIQQAALQLGERALEMLIYELFSDEAESEKIILVIHTIEGIGGDMTRLVLEIALQVFTGKRIQNAVLISLFEALGRIGTLSTEAELNIIYERYRRENQEALALAAYNAINRIKVRNRNMKNGTQFEHRDLSKLPGKKHIEQDCDDAAQS